MQKLPEEQRKKHVAFRLTPGQFLAVQTLAKKRGVRQSELLREAIELHLRRHGFGPR